MKIYYHNFTKKLFNETDGVDFMDNYDEGDELYFSVAGNAIVEPISVEELKRKWDVH